MTTGAASAVPAELIGYATRAAELDDELRTKATSTTNEVDAFKSSGPDYGAYVANPGPAVTAYAGRNQTADAWVGRIGRAFHRADHRGWFGWILAAVRPPSGHVVTMNDADPLLDGAGWPSEEQAAEAGRRFADDVKQHLDAGEGEDGAAGRIEAWGDYLDRHRHDAAFTAAFFDRLGVDGTLRLPMMIERAYPMDDYGRPAWGLEAIRPFSEALGTALTRLPASFANELADYRGSYDYDDPQEYHVGLLFTAPDAVFPAAFLVRLADNLVATPLWRNYDASPLHMTPFGPVVDPVANVLGALSRNQEAATRWLEEPFPDGDSNLELLLHRYANDMDGDGGRNAAATLRAGLTNPDLARSGPLFDQAMAAVNDAEGIRNFFNTEVLADATALHIERLTDTAGRSGGHEDLVTAHDFLEHLLADEAAATKVYDAALQSLYDTVGQAAPGDTLGSEAREVGSLLGLLLTADRNADIDSTNERIARRQSLLDGIREITDLGLTAVPGGRWVPFVKTGRNHLLDSFAIDGELDETLADADKFEHDIRDEIDRMFAARLAPDAQTAEEIHDAISGAGTAANERMDVIQRVLPDRG